jgi:hypothetical protein
LPATAHVLTFAMARELDDNGATMKFSNAIKASIANP